MSRMRRSKRIYYSPHAVQGIAHERLPVYAMRQEGISWLDSVVAAIERRTGLVCCARSPQGTTFDHGKPHTSDWELTLGRPVGKRIGDYSVVGSLRIAVPLPRPGVEYGDL